MSVGFSGWRQYLRIARQSPQVVILQGILEDILQAENLSSRSDPAEKI